MNIFKRSNVNRRVQTKSNQSRSFEERKKRRYVIGGVIGVLGFASWVFIFSYISFTSSLAITDVHIYGTEADIVPNLRAAVYRNLQGSYMGIFSRANAFLYSKSAITAAVASASGRVDQVSVSRDGLNSLTVSISEKSPSALACPGLPNFDNNGALVIPTSSDDGCYFTDLTGYIYRKVPVNAADIYNRYYVPALSDDPIGDYATTTQEFQELQGFVNSVRASGITPEATLIKPDGEYELYVKNQGKGNIALSLASSTAIIYFNDSASLTKELSDLSAFWNSMKLKNFEYIDVRYGSNVFYRLVQ